MTGASAANTLAASADLILSVGSRLQDFTTGSNALFSGQMISINVQTHDAVKQGALALVGDADETLAAIEEALPDLCISAAYADEIRSLQQAWAADVSAVTLAPEGNHLPSDSQVIGAVNRAAPDQAIVVGAAGSMPGELHKLWQTGQTDGYHMEYGFSCMGYEVAAGIGVNMACPDRPNIVFAGDGSYLMMNSELATAVMMGVCFTLVITDNRGFGCINRLQAATGGAPFNNLFSDSHHQQLPDIDYVAHAASMGANAVKVETIAALEDEVARAVAAGGVQVIVIDTDPGPSTAAGGTWWDVAPPAVSDRPGIAAIRSTYEQGRQGQKMGQK